MRRPFLFADGRRRHDEAKLDATVGGIVRRGRVLMTGQRAGGTVTRERKESLVPDVRKPPQDRGRPTTIASKTALERDVESSRLRRPVKSPL